MWDTREGKPLKSRNDEFVFNWTSDLELKWDGEVILSLVNQKQLSIFEHALPAQNTKEKGSTAGEKSPALRNASRKRTKTQH